jgi:hypothetical protein
MFIINKVFNSSFYLNNTPQFHFELYEFRSTSDRSYNFAVGANYVFMNWLYSLHEMWYFSESLCLFKYYISAISKSVI